LSKAELIPQAMTAKELKKFFAQHLHEVSQLKTPQGLATGFQPLDQFLLWGGIPKGAITLFSGTLGKGATSLWIDTAATVLRSGRWAAWINGEVPLSPVSLFHEGLDLERLLAIETPATEAKLLWMLQELMSSSLFEIIGCDLGSMRLKEHQIRKLNVAARDANVALVLFSEFKPLQGSAAVVFPLIISFEKRFITIERALHRPTPRLFPRSVSYARFTRHAKKARGQVSCLSRGKDDAIDGTADDPPVESNFMSETSRPEIGGATDGAIAERKS
jgi:hypothetical protein